MSKFNIALLLICISARSFNRGDDHTFQ